MRKRWKAAPALAAGLILSLAVPVLSAPDETVRAVQEELIAVGYDIGTADGISGPKTEEAIASYRQAAGLPAGSMIDEMLLESLKISGAGETAEDVQETEGEEIVGPERGETAREAVIVAMTNRYATDIFRSDGKTIDLAMFHPYGDGSGYSLEVTDPGTLTRNPDSSWHLEGLTLKAHDFEALFYVSADVRLEKEDCVVYNLSGYGPGSPDLSALAGSENYALFFTVPPSLLAGSPMTEEEMQRLLNPGMNREESLDSALTALQSEEADEMADPEMKAFFEEYESFMDSYCDLLRTFNEEDEEQVKKSAQMSEQLEGYKETAKAYDESSRENEYDRQYYLKSMIRINQKLMEAAINR